MADGYFLTPEERDLVQRLINKINRTPPGSRGTPDDDPKPAPDVYIVKAPAEGIPALTVAVGTGVDGYDTPGAALCDVWQIYRNDEEPELREQEHQVYVYNLSGLDVEGDSWNVVLRTKGGQWVVPFAVGTVVKFKLTEDMGATTANEASCEVYSHWDSTSEGYGSTGTGTAGVEGVVKDTAEIFGDATEDSYGIGHVRQGDGRTIIEPYNIQCP